MSATPTDPTILDMLRTLYDKLEAHNLLNVPAAGVSISVSRALGNIQVDTPSAKPRTRQAVKRAFKLSAAGGDGWRYLTGRDESDPNWILRVDLIGTHQCKIVDTLETPPDEASLAIAATLESLTPEQALAHVKKLAEERRKPGVKYVYNCEAVSLDEAAPDEWF